MSWSCARSVAVGDVPGMVGVEGTNQSSMALTPGPLSVAKERVGLHSRPSAVVSVERSKSWAMTVAPGPFSSIKETMGLSGWQRQKSVVEGRR